MSEALCAI